VSTLYTEDGQRRAQCGLRSSVVVRREQRVGLSASGLRPLSGALQEIVLEPIGEPFSQGAALSLQRPWEGSQSGRATRVNLTVGRVGLLVALDSHCTRGGTDIRSTRIAL
jgi:hypothetical protein